MGLWPLLDAALAASAAKRRDKVLVAACRWLLPDQLTMTRARLERGDEKVRAILDA